MIHMAQPQQLPPHLSHSNADNVFSKSSKCHQDHYFRCVLCTDCNYINVSIFQRNQKSEDTLSQLCQVRLVLLLFVFHVSGTGLTAR